MDPKPRLTYAGHIHLHFPQFQIVFRKDQQRSASDKQEQRRRFDRHSKKQTVRSFIHTFILLPAAMTLLSSRYLDIFATLGTPTGTINPLFLRDIPRSRNQRNWDQPSTRQDNSLSLILCLDHRKLKSHIRSNIPQEWDNRRDNKTDRAQEPQECRGDVLGG